MTVKHSLDAPNSRAELAIGLGLRRVRVPIRQSWATVYLELQGLNQNVTITRRRRIFIPTYENLGVERRSVAHTARSIWRFWPKTWQFARTPAVVACLCLALVVGFSIFVLEEQEPEVKIATVAVKAPTKASSICKLDSYSAQKLAIATNAWHKLGGVGYSEVTLRCRNKTKSFRVVKNLVTGELASVKPIG